MNYATAEVCTANIEATAAHNMDARTLEWDDMGDLEQCGEVEVVLAADCIFQPLYGDSFPLWDVLQRLAQLARHSGRQNPTVLLSAERRPNDGVDGFLDIARGDGAEIEELWRYENDSCGQRVFIYQLTLAS